MTALRENQRWLLLLLLFSLSSTETSCHEQHQRLHLLVYNNTALTGVPLSDAIIATGFRGDDNAISIPANSPFSAELLGTMSFIKRNSTKDLHYVDEENEHDEYYFHCDFGKATIAFLWIDDHMVCQWGAYQGSSLGGNQTVTSVDNPLRKLTKSNLSVRLELYFNDGDDEGAHEKSNGNTSGEKTVDVSVTVTCAPSSSSSLPFTDRACSHSYTLSPQLAAVEVQRHKLQRGLARGWGFWNHDSLMDAVHLPSGVYVRTSICSASSSGEDDCVTVARPSQNARPGILAHDRSYGQYYVATSNWNVSVQFSATTGGDLTGDSNYDSAGEELGMTLELVNASDDTELYVAVSGGVLWKRAAHIAASSKARTLTLSPYGLPKMTVCTVVGGDDELLFNEKSSKETTTSSSIAQPIRRLQNHRGESNSSFVLPLTRGKLIGLSSAQGGCNTTALVSALEKHKEAEIQRYAAFGNLAETRAVVQAGVMWNLVYNPVEAGPFTPVSRGWGGHLCPEHIGKEWCYTHFEWDDLFASYIMSLDTTHGKDLSYSNIIQIVRSKTSNGFVPNYACATSKSIDRTEPPVGAKVLLEIYHKYQDKWLVELLFDDLLDWSNWFMENRLVAPLNLIVLGGSSMQNARYESGLDNSPMYDGNDYYDENTSQMMLYDVGVSSLVSMEAHALSTLASAIGRHDEANMLLDRAAGLGRSIRDNLWDAEQGIFCNKFVRNETFYRRISPTSFYPMLAPHAVTAKQVETMVEHWLLNASRFCLSPNGDFEGNSDSCYWGLPSISADDPAYMVGKWIYWRGYVWGPMAQLLYWGLETYGRTIGHVHQFLGDRPLVEVARKSLVKQMRSMMLHQFQDHGHVCENYGPHKDTVDCTGDKFYHWGSLNGFLSFLEGDYYFPRER